MMAVPRGALFGETLDLLERIGTDVSEVRSNDRKLLFAEPGIVTMRPSDVPTYVEHGSADIGITGKDVLLEQEQRKVYELLDLGYGRCTMVVATQKGGDPIGSALRRLGRVRIATKYPRVAARHFAETGRQVEIVEVKGSVELAPLTGLVDGIVDLTATGRTLVENDLQVVEEIGRVHRTPDRQSGVPQAQGGRRSTAWWRSCAREDLPGGQAGAGRPRRPAWRPRCGRCWPRCATAATPRCWSSPSASTAPSCGRTSCAWTRTARCVRRRARAGRARRHPDRHRERPCGGGGAAARAHRGGAARRASGWRWPSRRFAARVSTCPAAGPPTPPPWSCCAVTARSAGVEEIAVCAPPGPGGEAHPVILAACVLCGVTEVYRMGGAQAIGALAFGTESVPAVDVIAGPGNAYVQEAKRQVLGHGGNRRHSAGPASWWWWPRARPTPS